MEGYRIAKNLSVYWSKYRERLRKHQDAESSKSGHEKLLNGSSNDAPDDRKVSTDLVKKLVPIKCSDGKFVELHLLNDYTSQHIKAEQIVTWAVGNVIEKWEIICRLLKNLLQQSEQADANSSERTLSPGAEHRSLLCHLNRCNSFDELTTNVSSDSQSVNTLNKSNFTDTINEGTEKVFLHGQNMSRILLDQGDFKNMLALLGSMILAKNRLAYYDSEMRTPDKKQPFQKSLTDLQEIISSLSARVTERNETFYRLDAPQHIQIMTMKHSWDNFDQFSKEMLHSSPTEYQSQLISTVVIHDGESQDWSSSKLYFEGERISSCVQFWGFHLQGLRADLFNHLPPVLARKTLSKIFEESLGCLTIRYCQIHPSYQRLEQYRGDITALLVISHDILLSLVEQPLELFHPSANNSDVALLVRSIHAKCTILVSALTMVGCPIKVFARILESSNLASFGSKSTTSLDVNMDGGNRLQPIDKNQEELRLTMWLHLILPGIYPNIPYKLSTPSFVYILGRICATQASPRWPLLIRLCLSRNMEFSQLIMTNFGAFVPGITGETFVKSMREGCGQLLCSRRCLGTADIYWPQVVASGILYIVMHGNPEKNSLICVLEPLLRKLSPSSWDVLNTSVMWNAKKPIWFQALLDLLEPYFHPIFDELVDDLEAGRTWTLSHVPEAINKMNVNILDIAHLIPPSFYQICELIESLLPDDVKPVCDSVVAHLFISSIYGIINKLIPVFREWKMQREKLDFLVAVGEKLCNLDNNTEMQKLEGLTDLSSNAKTEANHQWDNSQEEFVNIISEMVSSALPLLT